VQTPFKYCAGRWDFAFLCKAFLCKAFIILYKHTRLNKIMSERIKFVEWGVANNFGDCIEIHKDLPNYPSLYIPIMDHERRHSKKTFTLYDLLHDLKRTRGLSRIRLWKFMIMRPKTWIQILPIYYKKERGIVYDLNLTIIYLISVLLIWVLIIII